MKIVFICGALEPGRDGVGDYTRRLAWELQRQGHVVTALALRDFVVEIETAEVQAGEGSALPVLRLPGRWSNAARFAAARRYLNTVNPDWLSLQFVLFAFHPKGLPFGYGRQLARLGEGSSWHLMLHELWVGMEPDEPLLQRWWGRLQRYLIKDLIARLRPRVIHTQTQLYQAQLAQIGIESQYLPLFANVPNLYSNAASIRPEAGQPRDQGVSLVVFGTIHAGTPVAELAREAAHYAQTRAVPVSLTLVGRCGAGQDEWAQAWQGVGLPLEILGEQPAERISAVLRASSLGIATTPASLIGKSGTAAAMLEHGLRVLCVAQAWVPAGIPVPELPAGVLIYREGALAAALESPPLPAVASKVADVAQLLLAALRQSIG